MPGDARPQFLQVVLPVRFGTRYLPVTGEGLQHPQVMPRLQLVGDHALPDALGQEPLPLLRVSRTVLPKRMVGFPLVAAARDQAALVQLVYGNGGSWGGVNKDSPTRRTKIFFHAFSPGTKAREIAVLGAWVAGGPVSTSGSWHR